jgi:hypothetical protein
MGVIIHFYLTTLVIQSLTTYQENGCLQTRTEDGSNYSFLLNNVGYTELNPSLSDSKIYTS